VTCAVPLLSGCLRARPRPYSPSRPWLAPDPGSQSSVRAFRQFPERNLDEILDSDPPHVLGNIEEIYRQITLLQGPEPEWRRVPVDAEIGRIRADFDKLKIGEGRLAGLHLGNPRPKGAADARRAANLQIRWGLALMRTGGVNERVWGADRITEAASWDPDNPIGVLVLAGYEEIGGFWSKERDLLDRWAYKHGPNDLIDLQRLRKQERRWKVERDSAGLWEALRLGHEMADRHGGWRMSPAWLNLEHARLLLQADSLSGAEAAASLTLRRDEESGGTDFLSASQAELLLGLAAVRRLDYAEADGHFLRSLELGAREPALSGLVSWMKVPWDLFSSEEKSDFDHEPDRDSWIDDWWRLRDPVLATPTLLENRLEYYRRVGESWFALDGIDLAVPGPLTDPGQVILRFGVPDEWTGLTEETGIVGSFGVGTQAMLFFYSSFDGSYSERPLLFLSNALGTRFTSVDSLTGPDWPDWIPRYGFEDLDYRLSTAADVLRLPDGGTRMIFSFDTWLPEYSVRYPLQGLRFDGEVRVKLALFRPRGSTPALVQQKELVLAGETTVEAEWPLRRRSGMQVVDLGDDGAYRLATELDLRTSGGRMVAMSVDNGRLFSVESFSEKELDASSLVFLDGLPDSLDHRQVREIGPGHFASGPDLVRSHLSPRADHFLLRGEELAFYLEAYNLTMKQESIDAELLVVVEHLDANGAVDYSVGTQGPTMTLVGHRLNQWNIARSLGSLSLDPGNYRLRVNVYDQLAERRVERTAEFRIGTSSELVERCGWDRLASPDEVAEGIRTKLP
jgi:hypothetical protein